MLNFDPHRWIAEHEANPPRESVATVASVAGVSPQIEKSVLSSRPATVATTATVRAFRAALDRISADTPLHGLPADRWRQMLDDAGWLLEGFAPPAFRHGWTIGELFGLWWWDDNGTRTPKGGWGGIADRLQGSRSLKMTADRATWRVMFTGEPHVFLRTAYPELQPLWEPHP